MMRVQGGTRGILAAIDAGRLDPLDGWLPDEREISPRTASDRRRAMRRERARRKRMEQRSPF
jgi:hypothetical protein